VLCAFVVMNYSGSKAFNHFAQNYFAFQNPWPAAPEAAAAGARAGFAFLH
jgi:hypothetical protein